MFSLQLTAVVSSLVIILRYREAICVFDVPVNDTFSPDFLGPFGLMCSLQSPPWVQLSS